MSFNSYVDFQRDDLTSL